jgi:hypothetical protein
MFSMLGGSCEREATQVQTAKKKGKTKQNNNQQTQVVA